MSDNKIKHFASAPSCECVTLCIVCSVNASSCSGRVKVQCGLFPFTCRTQTSKRAKKETNNVPKRKGRPKKNVPVIEQQPEITEVLDVGELVTPSQAEEMVPAPPSAPVLILESALIPAQVPAPPPDLPQIPAVVPLPVPDVTPEMKPSSDALLQEVLIEDLGPDEEEDRAAAQEEPVIDQGLNQHLFRIERVHAKFDNPGHHRIRSMCT